MGCDLLGINWLESSSDPSVRSSSSSKLFSTGRLARLLSKSHSDSLESLVNKAPSLHCLGRAGGGVSLELGSGCSMSSAVCALSVSDSETDCVREKYSYVSLCVCVCECKGPSALYNWKWLRSYTNRFRVSAPKTRSRFIVEVVSSPSSLMRWLGKEQNDSLTSEVTITAESALFVTWNTQNNSTVTVQTRINTIQNESTLVGAKRFIFGCSTDGP